MAKAEGTVRTGRGPGVRGEGAGKVGKSRRGRRIALRCSAMVFEAIGRVPILRCTERRRWEIREINLIDMTWYDDIAVDERSVRCGVACVAD
jgi:hypothetical protein